MSHSPRARLRLALLVLVAALAPVAHAQHYLVVMDADGNPHLVKGASTTLNRTRVEIPNPAGTALQTTNSIDFRFPEAPLWGRGLVDVSDLKVAIVSGRGVVSAHGTLKSSLSLPHCVIVLIAKSPGDNEIKFYPVPAAGKDLELPADQPVKFDREWPLAPAFDRLKGTLELHLFSNGLEIPTSQLTAEELAAARDKSDAYALRNHPDSQIALRHIVSPVYPDALKAQNLAGSATLRCRVDRDGNVSSADVVSATQPAFGEAAVAAALQWKFAPAVRDHHYVEQTAEIPVAFPAPNPAAATAAHP